MKEVLQTAWLKIRMHKKGYSIEQIGDMLDMDIEKVKAIVDNE